MDTFRFVNETYTVSPLQSASKIGSVQLQKVGTQLKNQYVLRVINLIFLNLLNDVVDDLLLLMV